MRAVTTNAVGTMAANMIAPQDTIGTSDLYSESCRIGDLSRYMPITAIMAGTRKARLPSSHLMIEERIVHST